MDRMIHSLSGANVTTQGIRNRGRKGRALAGLGVFLALASTLGGCDEPSSPRGAVQRVARALATQDEAALRASLNGAALRRYGSSTGAQALHKAVAGRSLSLGEAALRYRDERVTGFDGLRIYTLPVLEKGQGAALVATVTCSVHWVSTAGYAYRAPVVEPAGRVQGGEGYTAMESCRVSDVEIADQGTAGAALLSQDRPSATALDADKGRS